MQQQTSASIVALGATDIRLAPLGVGTWAWGDTSFWQYGSDHDANDVTEAFWASLAAGVTLFDTAEIYGRGVSEKLLGSLARSTEQPLVIATKFFPLPWRLSAKTLHGALVASLDRLQVSQVDLYQIHWPTPLIGNQSLMDALADVVANGQVRAVGVSNYNAEQMKRAHEALARRGVPLASNQVEYSLAHRAPERNGVLAACHELNIALIAYSPLAMGLLTGKYNSSNRPKGVRGFIPRFQRKQLESTQPVVEKLRVIGEKYQKKPAQVALNWLIQQGTIPIPGAKNLKQAQDNAGALGWDLEEEDVAALAAL